MQESRSSGIMGGTEEAGEGTRTPNLLITNQLLYQLSYAGDVLEILMPGAAAHILSDRKTMPTAARTKTSNSQADRPSPGDGSVASCGPSSGVRTTPVDVRS
jgi:hypothetical protein